jgi:hypothetical protein
MVQLETIKNPKDRKLISEYNDKLETIRKTLVATKTGTAITGEKQMREKISELFAEISFYQGRPTEYQMVRMKGFREEVTEKTREINKINNAYLENVNKAISKSGGKPIVLMNASAWNTKNIKP